MKTKNDTNKHLAVGMHRNHPSVVDGISVWNFSFFCGEETISNERDREKSSINRELVRKVVAHKITMNNTHCKTKTLLMPRDMFLIPVDPYPVYACRSVLSQRDHHSASI